jgi:methylmalonyl-CoA mutase C-terminal domain/subunit
MGKKIRVVIARLGLDAHWRGSIVVAQALRDAGMEVIYVGNQMPEAIAETAIQEDADVIGLSSLSGNHLTLAPKVVEFLRQKGEGTSC